MAEDNIAGGIAGAGAPLRPTLASTNGDTQAIIEVAQAAAEPNELDIEATYGVIVPEGSRFELVDLESQQLRPSRPRGVYRLATVDALVAYVKRLQDADETTVWVHPTEGRVEAVLNDHGQKPGHADHRAKLDLIGAPEWEHWLSRNGQLTDQETFAEHLEDGVAQLVEPAAADMLEIAQSFHASQAATIRHARRLDSGQVNVVYDEKIEATAGQQGELNVPTEFKLAIPPFVGEEPYEVTARLRFRLNAGNLRIGYRLDQPEAVVRDALGKIAERLGEEFDRVYMGVPA